MLFIFDSPSSSSPIIIKPFFDSEVKVDAKLVTSTIFIYSSAPEAAFAREPVSPGLCFLVVIIDDAPNTFDDLIIAPIF